MFVFSTLSLIVPNGQKQATGVLKIICSAAVRKLKLEIRQFF